MGLAAIFGESGSGKSFLAIDIAAAIAGGTDWFGFKTAKSPVVYVMLEGEAGLRNRCVAWEKANNTPLPFKAITQPFSFLALKDVTDLAEVIPAGAVVIIDTLNRAAPTTDENSSKEMGQLLQSAKRLQAETSGLIVIVHHTGKDPNRGMRGHSSLHAALDAAIEVKRNGSIREWSVAKAKDGDDENHFSFKLERHVLGQDSDGDEITSCTIVRDHSGMFVKAPPKGAKQRAALTALKKALAIGQYQSVVISGCPTGTPNIAMDDAISYVASSLTSTEKNKRRNEAKRLIEGLLKSEHLGSALDDSSDAWCWVNQ